MQRDNKYIVICNSCNGEGLKEYYISHSEGSELGTCPVCEGSGRLIKSTKYKPFKIKENA